MFTKCRNLRPKALKVGGRGFRDTRCCRVWRTQGCGLVPQQVPCTRRGRGRTKPTGQWPGLRRRGGPSAAPRVGAGRRRAPAKAESRAGWPPAHTPWAPLTHPSRRAPHHEALAGTCRPNSRTLDPHPPPAETRSVPQTPKRGLGPPLTAPHPHARPQGPEAAPGPGRGGRLQEGEGLPGTQCAQLPPHGP